MYCKISDVLQNCVANKQRKFGKKVHKFLTKTCIRSDCTALAMTSVPPSGVSVPLPYPGGWAFAGYPVVQSCCRPPYVPWRVTRISAVRDSTENERKCANCIYDVNQRQIKLYIFATECIWKENMPSFTVMSVFLKPTTLFAASAGTSIFATDWPWIISGGCVSDNKWNV